MNRQPVIQEIPQPDPDPDPEPYTSIGDAGGGEDGAHLVNLNIDPSLRGIAGVGGASTGKGVNAGSSSKKKEKGEGGKVDEVSGKGSGRLPEGEEMFKRKMACMSCRLIKLRCLLASPTSTQLDPCRRCAKMGLVCEYKPKRRPVKVGAGGGGGGKGGKGKAKAAEDKSNRTSPTAQTQQQQSQTTSASQSKPKTSSAVPLLHAPYQSLPSLTSTSSVRSPSNSYANQPRPPPVPDIHQIGQGYDNDNDHHHYDHDQDDDHDQSMSRHSYSGSDEESETSPASLRSGLPMATTGMPVMGLGEGIYPEISRARNGAEESEMGVGGGTTIDGRLPDLEDIRRKRIGGLDGTVPLPIQPHHHPILNLSSTGYFGGVIHSQHPISSARQGQISDARDSGYPGEAGPSSGSQGRLMSPGTSGAIASLRRSLSYSQGNEPQPQQLPTYSPQTYSSASPNNASRSRIPVQGPTTFPYNDPIPTMTITPDPARDSNREPTPDPTNTKGRLPMALASILDLMRKDSTPPPPPLANTEMDVEGMTSSGYKRRRSVELLEGLAANGGRDDRKIEESSQQRPEKKMRWEEEQAVRATEPMEAATDSRADEAVSIEAAELRRQAGDPVRLGYVTNDDVRYLFRRFFDSHNNYIALLDSELHTPEYCFSTSLTLFVAILTVTANAYLPEKYPPLIRHATELLGEAFKNSDVEIGLCQALSILSVWKESADRGSYLRVGYAIRVAYELGLDAQQRRPLPLDERAAREVLNRERTWFQLTMIDRTLYTMHGKRPRMINMEPMADAVAWASDHMPVYCWSDGMLAASYTSGRFSSVINLNKKREPQGISYKVILHRLQVEQSEWSVTWLGLKPPVPLHPLSRAIIGFYLHINNFEISEFARCGVPGGNSMEALSTSVNNAIRLLRYIVDTLDPADVLTIAPDVITIRAAKCGVFLARNTHKIPNTVVEEIFSVFKQLIRVCRRVSHGQDTAFYQAKFFSSLLRASSVAPSRVVSRIGSPTAGSSSRPFANNLAMTQSLQRDQLAATLAADDTGGGPSGDLSQDLFGDMDLFQFDENLSIDALLQESHDWFSLDLMSHINDPSWASPPVITLPGPYGLAPTDPVEDDFHA